jgi:hypothetical protein
MIGEMLLSKVARDHEEISTSVLHLANQILIESEWPIWIMLRPTDSSRNDFRETTKDLHSLFDENSINLLRYLRRGRTDSIDIGQTGERLHGTEAARRTMKPGEAAP